MRTRLTNRKANKYRLTKRDNIQTSRHPSVWCWRNRLIDMNEAADKHMQSGSTMHGDRDSYTQTDWKDKVVRQKQR